MASQIAHHAIINSITRRGIDRGAGGSATEMILEDLEAPEHVDSALDEEYRREIFLVAAAQVRDEVGEEPWACFWETTIAERSVDDVAKQFNRTRGSIYSVRCRIIERLKQIVDRLDHQGELI